ncbi:MAG: elongation factor 4, partial [Candidatus Omnitrophica bacterium]|nr:elongation factor 4 [Candidatus Omnitrophota bacterium]
MIPRARIRNFCIIAHIDHGKSTLADRLLLATGAITPREFRHQLLDDMDLERERGITIKASAVRLQYRARDGQDYVLNLIDTPGHVDFTYEVSKSLRACEGALLVVDAGQGVEAQTVANLYLAREHQLTIIPVINKVDLPNADAPRVQRQLAETLSLTAAPALVSAKEGTGVDELLERIVREVPPPAGDPAQPLQALIFDSKFDVYKGVILYCRVIHGTLAAGMPVLLMGARRTHEVQEVGVLTPRPTTVTALAAGEVGYVTGNIKEAREVRAGDTVTHARAPATAPLPGYKPVHPLVFCGLYPVNAKDFPALREALEKLRLSDASFSFEPETSSSFGFGFRCGFLGLLHLEIIQERLEREFGLNLIATTPNVVYRVRLRRGTTVEIDNPTTLPSTGEIDTLEEPVIRAFLIAPADALGPVMALAQERRGVYQSTQYLGT